jgi:hypothetical protein
MVDQILGANLSLKRAGRLNPETLFPRNEHEPPRHTHSFRKQVNQSTTITPSPDSAIDAKAGLKDEHRLPAKDHPRSSIEIPGTTDDYDMSWTPAIQKLYDEFLVDERMYVSEDLWDKFPAGSRLFIGEQNITYCSTLSN